MNRDDIHRRNPGRRFFVALLATTLLSMAAVWISPAQAAVPDSPTIEDVSAGDGFVTLRFNEPTTDPALTGYTVNVTPDGGQTIALVLDGVDVGTTVATDGATATIVNPEGGLVTIRIDGLTNGTSYTLAVAASNGDGTSPPSAASDPVVPVAYTMSVVAAGPTTCHFDEGQGVYLTAVVVDDVPTSIDCEIAADDMMARVQAGAVFAIADRFRSTAPLVLQGNQLFLVTGDIAIEAAITADGADLTFMSFGDIHIEAPIAANDAAVTIGYGVVDEQMSGYGARGSKLMMAMNDAYGFDGRLDFFAADGTTPRTGTGFLTINGEAFTVIGDLAGLQAMSNDLTGRYALAGDVVGGAFTPVGAHPLYPATSFTGVFDGLGHRISGLSHANTSLEFVGLFGAARAAVIRNVGLTDVDIAGYSRVGALVGSGNALTVHDVFATGSVSGTQSQVGGLFGVVTDIEESTDRSYIGHAYANVDVTGSSWSVGGLAGIVGNADMEHVRAAGTITGRGNVGGLVGDLIVGSTLTDAHASGSVNSGSGVTGGLVGYVYGSSTISRSYATGTVSGAGGWGVGGLVGEMWSSTLDDSYAMGEVTGADAVGGLVGATDGTITHSYATGLVALSPETYGGAVIGGLIGDDYGGTVTAGFWNTETTGQSTSAGGTGKTTAEMSDPATFAGWNLLEDVDAPAGAPTFAADGVHVWTMRPAGGGPVSHTVTASAGSNGSVVSSNPLEVSEGDAATFTVTADAGHAPMHTVGGDCPAGTWSGSTWTTGAITQACAVAFEFAPVEMPPPADGEPGAGAGLAVVTVADDPDAGTWVFDPDNPPQWFAADAGEIDGEPIPPPPAGYDYPYDMLDFTLVMGESGSSARVTITYPEPLPAGTVYWKYGFADAQAQTRSWYRLPADRYEIDGNRLTLILTDGELGDDDWSVNRIIRDPGMPGFGAMEAIPLLSSWAMLLLAGMLWLLAAGRLPRGVRVG